MRKLLLTFAGAALLVIPAQQAQAQISGGPAIMYHDDFDLGVGGFISTPLTALHENMRIGVNGGLFFPDEDSFGADFSYFEINGDLTWSFPIDAAVTPFALGGINIARFSVDTGFEVPGFSFDASATEIGLNLGGGVMFGGEDASFRPLAGAKIELNGGEGLVVFGGLAFGG